VKILLTDSGPLPSKSATSALPSYVHASHYQQVRHFTLYNSKLLVVGNVAIILTATDSWQSVPITDATRMLAINTSFTDRTVARPGAVSSVASHLRGFTHESEHSQRAFWLCCLQNTCSCSNKRSRRCVRKLSVIGMKLAARTCARSGLEVILQRRMANFSTGVWALLCIRRVDN